MNFVVKQRILTNQDHWNSIANLVNSTIKSRYELWWPDVSTLANGSFVTETYYYEVWHADYAGLSDWNDLFNSDDVNVTIVK